MVRTRVSETLCDDEHKQSHTACLLSACLVHIYPWCSCNTHVLDIIMRPSFGQMSNLLKVNGGAPPLVQIVTSYIDAKMNFSIIIWNMISESRGFRKCIDLSIWQRRACLIANNLLLQYRTIWFWQGHSSSFPPITTSIHYLILFSKLSIRNLYLRKIPVSRHFLLKKESIMVPVK